MFDKSLTQDKSFLWFFHGERCNFLVEAEPRQTDVLTQRGANSQEATT